MMELKNLPNFYIIGAAKAGTTTLFDTLKQYDGVFLPYQKEPSFFCDDDYYRNGLAWYLKTYFYDAAQYPVRGEASPRYLFWGEKVVSNWKKVDPNYKPKVIVIFRDPVKLVYSFYWQMKREGKETLPFREALDAEEERYRENFNWLSSRGKITNLYSRIGRFASQLTPYLDFLPRENFQFLLTEDLKDFNLTTKRLEGFLDLPHREWNSPVASNQSRLPRNERLYRMLTDRSAIKELIKPLFSRKFRFKLKSLALNANLAKFTPPPIEEDLAERVRTLYRPEMIKLETMIGRDLSSWYSV
jgi:hypothetical protein